MKRPPALVWLALSIAVLPGCGGPGGGSGLPGAIEGDGVERIDIAMNDIMDRYSPPGIAVAVVGNRAREQDFVNDLINGLIRAVDGITEWPQADLFAR
jgi:hypothetical protein